MPVYMCVHAVGNQHKRARGFASENVAPEAPAKRPKLASIYPTPSVHVGELDDGELEDLVLSGNKPAEVE